MISWLWNIMVGSLCSHKYEVFKTANIWGSCPKRPMGIRFYMQCEKCGNIKIKTG